MTLTQSDRDDFYPCRALRHHTPDEIVALYRTLHAPPPRPRPWKTLCQRLLAFAPWREI
jgi:hypothetical protein